LIKTNPYTAKNLWLYSLYMLVACAVTAGLNIVHTKYVLNIDLYASLFVVPTVAGLLFGFTVARSKIMHTENLRAIRYSCDAGVIAKHIVQACFVTCALNVVHTEWILKQPLSSDLFVAPLIAGIFFGYLIARVNILNNKLLRLASTDLLTRTANRMQFDKCLKQELEQAKKSGNTFSLIYFDIDNFKEINDRFGHLAGDHILVEVAHCVKKTIRRHDVLARYGGDEFIILARSANLQTSLQLAEEIKHQVCTNARGNAAHGNGEAIAVSCSFGVVEYSPQRDSVLSLIKDADNALYTAKNEGRNCVAAG